MLESFVYQVAFAKGPKKSVKFDTCFLGDSFGGIFDMTFIYNLT